MKYKISEIFDLSQKTNNSSFTKEFVEKQRGRGKTHKKKLCTGQQLLFAYDQTYRKNFG